MICVQVDVRLFYFNPNQSYWLPEHQLSQSPTAYISCAQRMVLT